MRTLFLTLALVALFAVGAQAQDEAPRFDLSTGGFGKADVDNRGGEYSVFHSNVLAGYKGFTFSYTRSDYNWEHTSALPFSKHKGDPWDTLHLLALDAKTSGPVSDTLGWFAGGTVTSGFEDQIAHSFSVMGRGGFSWTANEDFRVRLGGIGILAPVHSMLLPLVGLDWRDESDLGFSATLGAPMTTLRYRFNPIVSTHLDSSWKRTLHRLSNDSAVSKEGYVEEDGYTTGAYVDLTPLEALKLTLGAEVLTGRYLRLFDDNGDRLNKYKVDSSVGGVVRLSYSF